MTISDVRVWVDGRSNGGMRNLCLDKPQVGKGGLYLHVVWSQSGGQMTDVVVRA